MGRSARTDDAAPAEERARSAAAGARSPDPRSSTAACISMPAPRASSPASIRRVRSPNRSSRCSSRDVAPIWMDSSTSAECARDRDRGRRRSQALAQRTGSRAFERFTAAQIRKFSKRDPAAYAATDRIHLVSSFLASLLIGGHAPLDPGDGSGMNLMDLASLPVVAAGGRVDGAGSRRQTSADCAARPRSSARSRRTGRRDTVFRRRRWSPGRATIRAASSASGLVREGRLAISLGHERYRVRPDARAARRSHGHRSRVRRANRRLHGADLFQERLARPRAHSRPIRLVVGHVLRGAASDAAGNGGRIMLPWFEPEITPTVLTPGVRRYRPRSE